jgi:hypothetical protein
MNGLHTGSEPILAMLQQRAAGLRSELAQTEAAIKALS